MTELTVRVVADTDGALSAIGAVQARLDELNHALAALVERGVSIPMRVVDSGQPPAGQVDGVRVGLAGLVALWRRMAEGPESSIEDAATRETLQLCAAALEKVLKGPSYADGHPAGGPRD